MTDTVETTAIPETSRHSLIKWAWAKYSGFHMIAAAEKRNFTWASYILLVVAILQSVASFLGTVWEVWFFSPPIYVFQEKTLTDLIVLLTSVPLALFVVFTPGRHWVVTRVAANQIRDAIRRYRSGFITDAGVFLDTVNKAVADARSSGVTQVLPEWDGKKLPLHSVNDKKDDGYQDYDIHLLMAELDGKAKYHRDNARMFERNHWRLTVALVCLNISAGVLSWFDGTTLVLFTGLLTLLIQRHFGPHRWQDQASREVMAADEFDRHLGEWVGRHEELLADPTKLRNFMEQVLISWEQEQTTWGQLMGSVVMAFDQKKEAKNDNSDQTS